MASNSDMSWREIAKTVGKSKSTVSDYLRSMSETINKIQDAHRNGAKILLYDVEMAPASHLTFGRFKQYISEPQVLEEGYMLTWAAQWLDSGTIMEDKITNYDLFDENHHDDEHIVKSLWELIDEADVIVAHNNDFDEKTFNTRAIAHGLVPPHPSKRICTYKLCKGKFRFPSNSLKSLAVFLGLTNKIENDGFSLWRRCWLGDSDAIQTMQDYNVGDITTLRELYLKVGPWDNRSPNLSLFTNIKDENCGHCTSTYLTPTGKYVITGVSKFETVRCDNCGKISRRRTNIVSKYDRKNILMNVAN